VPALSNPGSSVLSCPPAAPVHAWMPSSPCSPGCVETLARAGLLRAVGRAMGVVGLFVSFPAVNALTPRGRRHGLQRGYARAVLRCCGIGLRIVDQRFGDVGAHQLPDSADPAGDVPEIRAAGAGQLVSGVADSPGLLVVAGHVGWTDVIALAAVQPMGFVARADLIEWPLLGRLARFMRVIPIERERLRQLPEVISAIAARLRAGDRVTVFPEGTTWCGRAHGRHRPALYQAAVDTGAPVQPIRVRYLDHEGKVSTIPGFVGTDTFLDSVSRVLHSKGVTAEIVLLAPQAPGPDRHDLARRCEQAIRGPEMVDIDAHATAVGTGPTREIVQDNEIRSTATVS
jgi:1-acyl-sn-glycerol-3-phosphate acyltransferase